MPSTAGETSALVLTVAVLNPAAGAASLMTQNNT
jgi:hypothetical protein